VRFPRAALMTRSDPPRIDPPPRRRLALRPLLVGVLGLAALTPSGPAAPSRADPGQPGPERVAVCLRAAQCRETFVVAHRALGFGAPENSIEAVERALEHGIRVVKVDLRASRDGEVFVLHDPTLDRTTTHRGEIGDRTASELGTIRLRNGEPLPRFEDMYRRFAGRVVFVLDCKVDLTERVAGWMAAHGSLDDVVFLVGSAEHMRSLARARARHPAILVAARLVNWWDLPVIWEIFGGPPHFLHTDLTTADDLAELRRRASGVKVFVKALDVERRIWPFGELAVQAIVDARPELILTGAPVRFQQQIRERAPTTGSHARARP
jgi:glycerophosphoryl diester phosphodiesterase